MRKFYWLLTSLIFCLGIAVGVLGYSSWGYLLKSDTGITTTGVTASDLAYPGDEQTGEEIRTALTQTEQDRIISDYKQAIGILFDSWKVNDIAVFRTTLANAYTGEIMESHVKKAEKYLPQGIGLYVSEIIFDSVTVESADNYSATVDAIYRYTAQDYDLDEAYPYGEKTSHFVHVRANLVKVDSRWMITSETVI